MRSRGRSGGDHQIKSKSVQGICRKEIKMGRDNKEIKRWKRIKEEMVLRKTDELAVRNSDLSGPFFCLLRCCTVRKGKNPGEGDSVFWGKAF